MDFVTIDFETATSDYSSACEIGLTFVNSGSVQDTKTWLIQPPDNEYDYFNIKIHGISAKSTEKELIFPNVWIEVSKYINGNIIVAHNAAFDMAVLRHTLDYYKIPHPTLNYLCSYLLAKSLWKELVSYKLQDLCYMKNIPLLNGSHRAGADSIAAAQLMLLLLKDGNINSIKDVDKYLKMGKLNPASYTTCSIKKPKIVGDESKHNKNSIFYGKNIVFTGELRAIGRNLAKQIVLDIGANIQSSITKTTDFLIEGIQDLDVVDASGLSSKQKKVKELLAKGVQIVTMNEKEFLETINSK